MSRTISLEGIRFIEEVEGVELKVYRDVAGYLTVGVGHLVRPKDNLKEGDIISQERCDQLLQDDLESAEKAVDWSVTVRLNDNQFTALVSFAFNVGVNAFKTSTLLKKLNAGDYAGAGEQFGRWTHAGGKFVQGLANRRKKEKELFFTPARDQVLPD